MKHKKQYLVKDCLIESLKYYTVMAMLVLLQLKKLWTDHCQKEFEGIICSSGDQKVAVSCDCCTKYTEWKEKHQDTLRVLQSIADMPCYYRVSNETIKIAKTSYETTIRAMHSAPLGACKGVALKSGPHPYICDARGMAKTVNCYTSLGVLQN